LCVNFLSQSLSDGIIALLFVFLPEGRSNALNIASRLGLDPAIIDVARRRLAVGVAAANAAIEELEAVQEELRAADMLLFAVNANAQETKVCGLMGRLILWGGAGGGVVCWSGLRGGLVWTPFACGVVVSRESFTDMVLFAVDANAQETKVCSLRGGWEGGLLWTPSACEPGVCNQLSAVVAR
jgi:hypothetical protein